MKSSFKKLFIDLCLLLIFVAVFWQQKRVIYLPKTNITIEHEKNERTVTIKNDDKSKQVIPKVEFAKAACFHDVQVPKVLVAGGLFIPLVFEDNLQATLSEEQRAEVIRDIQLIYGHLDQFATYETDCLELRAGGIDLTVAKKIQFIGSGRYFPPAHRDTFGLLSGEPGNYKIVIPFELIAAYRQALDFVATNRQAFDQLNLFLPESGNCSEAWAKLEASDVVWTPDSLNISPKTKERIFNQMKNARIRKPSILDFTAENDEAHSGLTGLPEGSIVGKALLLDGRGVPQNYEAIVYLGGKWHLAVVPPGT